MNTNELYIEYARVIEMCKGTELEDTPWMGVKREGACSFHSHPTFSEHSDYYEFAVGVLENKFVFVNDVIYYKCDGERLEIVRSGRDGDIIIKELFNREVSIEFFPDDFTWTPPAIKRTFTLNGVELPCPSNTKQFGFYCAGRFYGFDSFDDTEKVSDTLANILTEARDKP
ncbi:MAG: hypothetical protein H6937_07240 [Burkholderiales bacterium]|nr:hypothetical protein [Burkholderiales bacterium]